MIAVLGTLFERRVVRYALPLAVIVGMIWWVMRDGAEAQQSPSLELRASHSWIQPFGRISLTTQLRVFPSLTDSPRTRAELDVDYAHEIVKDFFWKLTLYSSYDSRPPQDAEESDYGVVASIGWKF